MKIALLNLPFDNNYGGNLQRYALIKVLQGMGHEVEHINLHCSYSLPWYKYPYSIPKRIIIRYLLGQKNVDVLLEKHNKDIRKIIDANALAFYEKYIPHTFEVRNVSGIKKLLNSGNYDAVVVGSDQVWREGMTHSIGCENFFLKFVPDDIKKIAYSVSMGTNKNEYSAKQTKKLAKLYARFDAVSVRELSALDLLRNFGWNKPKPCLCLDPTLLLTQNDYIKLIIENKVKNLTSDKIFSYILDETENTKSVLNVYRRHLEKEIIKVGLKDTTDVSICQWLNNIRCADLVITDSYHGCVFSIIFNRPFVFLGNEGRGNSRIESLFEILGIKMDNTEEIDFGVLNEKKMELKMKSIDFINKIN